MTSLAVNLGLGIIQALALVLLTLSLLCGCSGDSNETGTVKISGRVTNAGEPLHVEGRDVGIGMVSIEFYRVQEDRQQLAKAASAAADAEGYFELVDAIPAGKYCIAIRQWDPHPYVDRLEGKFDPQRSGIVRIFKKDERLDLDTSRPKG